MSKNFKPTSIVLIPDVHAKPGDKLERLHALRAKLKKVPNISHVVQIGDLGSFDSLSLHDNQTPDWYTRSVGGDLAAFRQALTLVDHIAQDHGAAVHVTEGNHENRYNKWMLSDNRLTTSDFTKTVGAYVKKEMPWINYHAFQKPLIIRGAAFCHYVVSGLMNRAVGGERPAGTILKTQFMSTVVGHSHILDFAERTRVDGTKIYGLVSGCFVDPAAEFSYAGAAKALWWNGAHVLHFYKSGQFDLESLSIDRL